MNEKNTAEIKNLLDIFEFYLTERALGRPIDSLGESIRDMRHILERLLIDHFMKLPSKEEEKFLKTLATLLADRSTNVPAEEKGDEEYIDYCIGEILTVFETAGDIKERYSSDSILQKMLALDIPILRPFDYGTRNNLKLVKPKKRVKTHS